MNPDPDDVTFQFNQIQLTDEGDDSVNRSNEDADVTFVFNQVSSKSVTDSKSQQFAPGNDDVANDDDDVTFCFNQVQINTNDEPESQQLYADVEGEEEFSFMCINEKTVIPLFDQSLLYNKEDVPVNNIKSNSTGSSYPRRFRDNNNDMYRCNSDGRDAFVFFNPKTEGKEGVFLNPKMEGKGKGKEVVVVKKKVKKANVSALEEYLRKGEEEKRKKSYLTYSKRPQQPGPYGLTGVLYVSVKKGLRAASNILSS